MSSLMHGRELHVLMDETEIEILMTHPCVHAVRIMALWRHGWGLSRPVSVPYRTTVGVYIAVSPGPVTLLALYSCRMPAKWAASVNQTTSYNFGSVSQAWYAQDAAAKKAVTVMSGKSSSIPKQFIGFVLRVVVP